MSTKGEEVKSRKTLTASVKENPLASVAITAISSALVTLLSQTYATTAYVQGQRQEMTAYFEEKVKHLDDKNDINKQATAKLEDKLDKIDVKLDLIKDKIYSLKR